MRIIGAAVLALTLGLSSAPATAATVLTFDDLAKPGAGVHDLTTTGRFEYGGFVFQSNEGSQGFRSFGMNDPRNADPGGAAIFHNWSNSSMQLTKADGSLFDLISIDVADLQNVGARYGNSLDFVFGDGRTESMAFTTDALVGLETFLINRKGVKSLRLGTPFGQWWQLDNLTFGSTAAAVPEPGTWAMMILGFAGVGAALRRRRPQPLHSALTA